MPRRVLIIGGVAGGASTAAQRGVDALNLSGGFATWQALHDVGEF